MKALIRAQRRGPKLERPPEPEQEQAQEPMLQVPAATLAQPFEPVLHSPWTQPPPLKVGERVKHVLHAGGPEVVCEVIRVTPCAAYLQSTLRRPVTVVVDKVTEETRTFVAQETKTVPVSLYSQVERVIG